MRDFDYVRATSLAAAVQSFADGSEPRYLAGGQTLIPVMKQRLAEPGVLVDLAAIPELSGIAADPDGVTIGAMARHAEIARSADVRRVVPALAALAGEIGDPHVRNRGTLGGSLANNDPAADYPAAVLALGATIETDRRSIAADDFFLGLFTTALEEGEIIARVRFPACARAAYLKFRNPASHYAMVGVMVADGPVGIRVAVTGAGPGVFRVDAFETALARDFSARALDGLTVAADDLLADMHGSAAYRAHLVGVLARRAVAQITG